MSKRVLDIGNCGPDHASIRELLSEHFDAEVDQVDEISRGFELLRDRDYALALVNRILDYDGSPGLEVIRLLKSRYPDLPVMMITNFADHQNEAVALGAEAGFGKRQLATASTVQRLAKFLQ